MISLGQAKVGTKILWRRAPHEIIDANHQKLGRGGAKLVTKLRNLITGATLDFTFSGDEKLEPAEVRYRQVQYLYHEGDTSFFMTSDDFETVEVKIPEQRSQLLIEGSSADLMIWENQTIDVKLPPKVTLKVTYTEPGFKGNTQSSALKPAKLETGLEVNVPLFINVGDSIKINTVDGKYSSRITK